MVKIGKLEGITYEEYRRVLSYQVPVSFFGIEFNGKTPDIPLGVGGTPLA
jgi:hypothetical protein